MSIFRRASQAVSREAGQRQRRAVPGRPCGCSPPVYCGEGQRILARVDRGRRIAGQWGTWADHNQALVELALHLDREPSECWAMLRGGSSV